MKDKPKQNTGFCYTLSVNIIAAHNAGIAEGVDAIDLLCFDLLRQYKDYSGCKTLIEGSKVYYLFDWHLIPQRSKGILNVKSRSAVKKRLNNLIKCGLLEPHPENIKKRKSWFHFTPKCDFFLFADHAATVHENEPSANVYANRPPKETHTVRERGRIPSANVDAYEYTNSDNTYNELTNNEKDNKGKPCFLNGSFDNEKPEQETLSDKNKKKERKKVAPKKEKEPSRVHMGIELFNSRVADYLKARGIKDQTNPIDWSQKECGQLKALINKIEKRSNQADFIYTDDSDLIQTGLGAVIDAFIVIAKETGCSGTGWFTSSFKPSQMSGRLQEIKTEYNALKNGKSNRNKPSKEKPTAEFDQWADDVIDRWKVA